MLGTKRQDDFYLLLSTNLKANIIELLSLLKNEERSELMFGLLSLEKAFSFPGTLVFVWRVL